MYRMGVAAQLELSIPDFGLRNSKFKNQNLKFEIRNSKFEIISPCPVPLALRRNIIGADPVSIEL